MTLVFFLVKLVIIYPVTIYLLTPLCNRLDEQYKDSLEETPIKAFFFIYFSTLVTARSFAPIYFYTYMTNSLRY